MEFIEKHDLKENSHPCKWWRAFLPDKITKGDSNAFAIDKWARYTNIRAGIDFAGMPKHAGSSYKWKDFTPTEIEQYLSMYQIQDLCRSPRLTYKFRNQFEDPIQGNDLIYRVFGKAAVKRHKQFRKYFAVQNPHLSTPSNKTHTNWKVDPLLQ